MNRVPLPLPFTPAFKFRKINGLILAWKGAFWQLWGSMVLAGLEHEGHGHVCAWVCRNRAPAWWISALLGMGTRHSLGASRLPAELVLVYGNWLFPCCHLLDPLLLQPLSYLPGLGTFLSTYLPA